MEATIFRYLPHFEQRKMILQCPYLLGCKSSRNIEIVIMLEDTGCTMIDIMVQKYKANGLFQDLPR
jgi:hypothetical protein